MMRRLSQTFMDCLTTGFLAPLRDCVADDADLNLEIRANYLNVYYKGNSLLKLSEAGRRRRSTWRAILVPTGRRVVGIRWMRQLRILRLRSR